jgi:hypothetical protein
MKLDHLIYGTFPDTPGSQHVIYKSLGVSPAMETKLVNLYDRFGDCKNEDFKSSISVARFGGNPEEERYVITRVSHLGKDFSGRWGALLRHSAILTPEQYQALSYCPQSLESALISSGTAERLADFGDLVIDDPATSPDGRAGLPELLFEDYEANLGAVLSGQRLVLYAENNTGYSNRYVRNLVGLLPLHCRLLLHWSEYVFRTSDDLDLALVHSSRYESPTSGRLSFESIGENHLKELALSIDQIQSYLSGVSTALLDKDASQLALLLSREL